MKKLLLSWIGIADINAAHNQEQKNLGPVAQALKARDYDEAVLINNFTKAKGCKYINWIRDLIPKKEIKLYNEKLSGPTKFGEIHEVAVKIIQKHHKEDVSFTFHLSPGTPAMAAVWIILAKTRFPAELIESSLEQGVKTASVPFDISAEFIPDLLRKSDKQIKGLAAALPPEDPAFTDIIHRCPEMKRVIKKSNKVAFHSVPVLIEGETGTGKELLAKAIHNASPRQNENFVPVNCGAIPSELIESYLFGHKKGAFTGADRTKAGYFETADKGTLFLDEVGELPKQAQVKLLRVLEEGEITKVGGAKLKKVDVRIISATNRNLIIEIGGGCFRADLFYRLAVAVLHLPSLRERQGDISLLINHLLNDINKKMGTSKRLSPNAKNFLLHQHTWPGNIRELLNTLTRAVIWSNDSTIKKDDVHDAIILTDSYNKDEILNKPLDDSFNLQETLQIVEKNYILKAMDKTQNNKTEAAKLLGLPNYQTLTNRLKKYGI